MLRHRSSLDRSGPSRPLRRPVLIVIGAERTETAYFKGLRTHSRRSTVTMKIVEKPAAPDQLAAHCADCREVHARLRKHLPHYDKTRPRFADFAAGLDQAVRRAEKLGDDHTRNPSTGVWRLVDAVLEKQ